MAEETVAEPAVDSVDGSLPAAEAIAVALQATAHQYAAAEGKEEDAPRAPVQLGLLPRPPFDYRAALLRLADKEEQVAGLATRLDTAKKAHHAAKAEWDEASAELAAMVRQTARAMREREAMPEGEQQTLPVTRECAWERANPGQVCGVCTALRAQQITPEEAEAQHGELEIAEQIAADDVEPVPMLELPVVIQLKDTPNVYYGHDNDENLVWTADQSLAFTFQSVEEAEEYMVERGITDLGVIVPDPMAADPNAAAEQPAEPPQEPEADPLIIVGAECLAKADIEFIAHAGERGVCFDVHDGGYGFIFANGGSGGHFTPADVRLMLTVTGYVNGDIAAYQYRDDKKLQRDYAKGKFASAFPPPQEPEAQS